jgi:hypothetical protein
MDKNFPMGLGVGLEIHICEAQNSPDRNQRGTYIIIKLSNIKTTEIILKAAKEKRIVT